MSDLRERLRYLWSEIVRVEAELDQYTDYSFPPPEPNPPATAAQLEALQEHLGLQLPPSYREFLGLHNGIENFEYDLHLMSTEQIIANDEGWVEDLADEEPELARFFLAGDDDTNAGCYVFDHQKVDDGGEMEVVHFSMRLEETRWPSFLDLLEERLKRSEEHLKSERADRDLLPD